MLYYLLDLFMTLQHHVFRFLLAELIYQILIDESRPAGVVLPHELNSLGFDLRSSHSSGLWAWRLQSMYVIRVRSGLCLRLGFGLPQQDRSWSWGRFPSPVTLVQYLVLASRQTIPSTSGMSYAKWVFYHLGQYPYKDIPGNPQYS